MTGTPAAPLGMKWHKFLIYFSLWLSALVSLGSAAAYFTGAYYGENASYIYGMYTSLSVIDKVTAIACMGAAVLAIAARFSLARYKAKGPGRLTALYAVNIGISIVYLILVSIETGIQITDLADSSTLGSLVSSVAMIFVNKKYYAKRAFLFVN